MQENLIELAAVMDRFAALVSRLNLSETEVAALAGLSDWPQVLPGRLGKDSETRIRLFCELERELGQVFAVDKLPAWLRNTSLGSSPMEFLCGGADHMRAMICAARSLASPVERDSI